MEPESALSETDKFFSKFKASHTEALQMLAEFIETTIGNEMGALEEFFRFENSAMAMPPKSVSNIKFDFKDFPLRLYCLRISESLVILFNGGEKTTRDAQSGKTSMVFIEANQYANRILKAINNKELEINGRLILSKDRENSIIL